MATTPETQPSEQPENEFAALIEPIRPYIDKYGTKAILGVAAILIVAAAWIYFTKSANAEKARGWDELIQTGFPHPTISESMHESVLAAYGKALHI